MTTLVNTRTTATSSKFTTGWVLGPRELADGVASVETRFTHTRVFEMTARRNTGAHYVWGWPSLTVDDAPNDRRLLFAIRLTLFHIARRFAYTRRGLVLGWAVVACLSLTGAAAVLMATGSTGWAVAGGTIAPILMLIVLRHRAIRVRRHSPEGPPTAGVREPRSPVEPSGAATTSRTLP